VQEIHKKIMSLNFSDCHARICQVDCQSSVGGSVVVQVTQPHVLFLVIFSGKAGEVGNSKMVVEKSDRKPKVRETSLICRGKLIVSHQLLM